MAKWQSYGHFSISKLRNRDQNEENFDLDDFASLRVLSRAFANGTISMEI